MSWGGEKYFGLDLVTFMQIELQPTNHHGESTSKTVTR